MQRTVLFTFPLALATIVAWKPAAAAEAPSSANEPSKQIAITQSDDRVRVLLGGELFAEYVFRGYSRPIVYPIIGPYGIGMTRNYPMRDDVPGESHDHVHQKAMFLAFGSVNGVNFFGETADPENGEG